MELHHHQTRALRAPISSSLIKEPLCEKPSLIWLQCILSTNSARGEKKIDERVLVKDLNYGRNGFGRISYMSLYALYAQFLPGLH